MIINPDLDNAFLESILSFYDFFFEEMGNKSEEDEVDMEEMIRKAFCRFCPSDIPVELVEKTRDHYMKSAIYRDAIHEYKERIIIPACNENFSEIIEKYVDVYKIIDISVNVVFESALEILKHAKDCKDLDEFGLFIEE